MSKDCLTLTIRVHDPREKQDLALSASWVTIQIPREHVEMSTAEFAAKYLHPALAKITNLKLS